jgi:carboxypeptidase PM20D1
MINKILKFAGIVVLIFFLFILYLLFNTYRFTSKQIDVTQVEKTTTPDGALSRITEAISYRTISYEDKADFDSTQFSAFNEFLLRSYPLLHSIGEHKTFNEYSHLFKWVGQNTNLDPIVLMAHYDVVPIASLPLWTVHPFDEGIKNDTIYGRGALDDKGSLISILEAVEQLMTNGFVPSRTIYISLGHDEEVLGKDGAVQIAKFLENENIRAAFVLDEGGARTNTIKEVNSDIAVIGIAEKGFLSLDLVVNMAGGHSSMPEHETSIDVLSSAISKLKQNPLKASFTEVTNAFLDKVGPEYPFKLKILLANRGVFKSLLVKELAKTTSGNATFRTTTSPTIFEAGIKENVIPTSARAVVNFRILPGEDINSVISHVKTTINDERVIIAKMNTPENPSAISPIDTIFYTSLEKSIREVFPSTLVTPYLALGVTDSRHFKNISRNIYKFSPFKITPENLACFHGIDEWIPVSEFEDAIRFYTQIIINADKVK